ncbi:hypothetical protein DTO013E5_9533 [Penicillium roqueforti]|uniref:uncharacterized protein n=1 Tax=Penicillium roqueforti TaxID=5082 RepID=UPI00190B6896|nr:uncharacterized protein LCP9604111_8604 [Penicillium roqueforti]KAF9240750.1 hypothetical protein LCP9604111_8604 [Penicillium roqueforti]KAI1831983.1 hypothetical protein CBS147337_7055 [Penicillium roqueforti]KAI2673264.1 hypothetical protein CBS147355_7563 [Penicillium roqueforti]KAI2677360.1 hypothetical protein LCP963914a_8018 [Penicillium roqueforti]KAI2713735.1 hypothetical protein CBS147318_7013 [Penicillium roqueforti]
MDITWSQLGHSFHGQQELKMQATEKPTQSGIDLTLPEEKTQDAGGAVAAAANVALIARLIRHGSLELDFLRWYVDVVTKLGVLSLLKKKRWDSLQIFMSWTTAVATAEGSIELQYGDYLLMVMTVLLM